MKAHVKVHISIHLEDDSSTPTDPKLNEVIKYPLQSQFSGLRVVADKAEAERVVEALWNHVRSMSMQMGIQSVTGTHKPDLAAAFGGDPEPKAPTEIV